MHELRGEQPGEGRSSGRDDTDNMTGRMKGPRMALSATQALLAAWIAGSALGQTYTIETFAGGALPNNTPGTSASLWTVGTAVDAAGNVFIASLDAVFRLDAATGVLTLVAGDGTSGFRGDNGPATSAQLDGPSVAVDASGSLYIADSGNNRIRKVSNGVITTVAGNGTQGFGGDNGPATSAELYSPDGVAIDPSGNLYIADSGNHRIRKVSNGVIATVAGNGTRGFGGDNGLAASASLYYPSGVAVDALGNLYISDESSRIRKVSKGVITTVAGNGTQGFSGDNGPATSASLTSYCGVAVDALGDLYIADSGNNRIRKVSNGLITTVVGNGTAGFSGDNGPATSAQLNQAASVAVDISGSLYIADSDNNRIRKVSNGAIGTVAGNGICCFSGDNGPATGAQLNQTAGIAVDTSGSLYIADSLNSRIRKVSNGVITTVAGNGVNGFSGDNGPATSASLFYPSGVAVDTSGNLYISDDRNDRIRKVSNGVITTVAGSGFSCCDLGSGPAASASFDPSGVTVDTSGNLYIADFDNNRILKVSNGAFTTVAGGSTVLGDNGSATSARISHPRGVAVDTGGNLYIADYDDNRIRKVSNGVITTVAGNGTAGFSGDNSSATSASLQSPSGVAVDISGNLYIADSGNNRIRKVSNGVITTVAGDGIAGFSGDYGPATSASTQNPSGVAVDGLFNVYFSDGLNYRVRVLVPSVPPPAASPAITDVQNGASFAEGTIAPGSWVAIFGTNLAPAGDSRTWKASEIVNGKLPISLDGTSVTVNGKPAAVEFIEPSQVNIQPPDDTAIGPVQVVATTVTGASNSFTVNYAKFAPALSREPRPISLRNTPTTAMSPPRRRPHQAR